MYIVYKQREGSMMDQRIDLDRSLHGSPLLVLLLASETNECLEAPVSIRASQIYGTVYRVRT